jgi:glycosyltransferase involved in cell wall biosynthesis
MAKISLIITVLNEETTIVSLLNSFVAQTVLPSEVIIVDGGSTDLTVKKIQTFVKNFSTNKIKIVVDSKKGNRSIGRNYAISLAKNDLIVITDAGCVLAKNWLQELVKKHEESKAPVIAGYYSAQAQTDFQKAVVPYVLVMPDKINENKFLPATRSMLISKAIFNKMGGFDESLNDNEDYAFAKKLEKNKIQISFTKKAIVYWQPVESLEKFYKMIYRFAKGDIYSGIVRPKVLLIFLRYFIFLQLLFFAGALFWLVMLIYSWWAIQKNKPYVGSGWRYLPLLQVSSDIAVIHGSLVGLNQKLF